MTADSVNRSNLRHDRWHPFGAHGVILALPVSLVLWSLIVLPFV